MLFIFLKSAYGSRNCGVSGVGSGGGSGVTGSGVGSSEDSDGPGGGVGTISEDTGGSLVPLEGSLISDDSELSPGLGDAGLGSILGDADGAVLGDDLGPRI